MSRCLYVQPCNVGWRYKYTSIHAVTVSDSAQLRWTDCICVLTRPSAVQLSSPTKVWTAKDKLWRDRTPPSMLSTRNGSKMRQNAIFLHKIQNQYFVWQSGLPSPHSLCGSYRYTVQSIDKILSSSVSGLVCIIVCVWSSWCGLSYHQYRRPVVGCLYWRFAFR